MKVMEFEKFGGPEVLIETERPDPVAAPGGVLVQVRAVTVNPADWLTRAGVLAGMTAHLSFPLVPGWDFAGVVATGAAGFVPGDRVAGLVPWFDAGNGTYAERVVVEPGWLARIPDGLDDAGAAAIGLNGLTAAQALDLLAVPAGATLLVTGASGAVGGFAVQLAAVAGVRVLAIPSVGDEAWVRGLGADQLVARGEPAAVVAAIRAVLPGGVDAVLDAAPVGPDLIGSVRDGGTFVTVLDYAMPSPERGVRVDKVGVHPDGTALQRLLDLAAVGSLRPRIADTLPLAEAAKAQEIAAAGGLRGKLVLSLGATEG